MWSWALAVCACQRRIRSLSEWQASFNSMLKSHHEVRREEKEGHSMWNIHKTLLKRCALPMTRLIIFRKCEELREKYMWDAFLTSLHTGWNCEAENPYGIIKISVSSSFFPLQKDFLLLPPKHTGKRNRKAKAPFNFYPNFWWTHTEEGTSTKTNVNIAAHDRVYQIIFI